MLKNLVLILWQVSEYVSGFKYVRILNIPKFSLIWQDSEYAPGCNYGRVMNILGLHICQFSAYASIAQGSGYDWIMPYGRILNITVQCFTCF